MATPPLGTTVPEPVIPAPTLRSDAPPPPPPPSPTPPGALAAEEPVQFGRPMSFWQRPWVQEV